MRDGRTSPFVGALLGAALTIVGVACGYLLKHPCLGSGPARPGDQYRRDCYSDIGALYGPRRAFFNPPDKPVPFAGHGLAYRDNNFEYPALTGLYVSGVNAVVAAGDRDGFFGANAAGLAIAGVIAGAALGAVAADRRRLLMFAIAPTMIAYAFHNWDLLPVALMTLGLVAFARDRDAAAGVLLGLGAAAKVFPAVAIPALILARWHERRWRDGWTLLVASILAFAAPNLIVAAYAGGDGFLFPWRMQTGRLPTFETFWYFAARHWRAPTKLYEFGPSGYASLTQRLSLLLFVGGAGTVLITEWRRRVFHPFAAVLGCLLVFLITSKVLSVQYMLWILPLLVLVRVPWHAWLAFTVADMAVLAGGWAIGVALIDGTNPSGYFGFLEAAVAARYAALGLVLWWSRRCDRSPDDRPPLDPVALTRGRQGRGVSSTG